mmetsp:Transcript_107652/g.301498  ORF Transcript_107652/g.301498 Transcript_107652/m.301498 type:complete len:203 (+) Transcript_107652:437-1045(+)
MRCSMALRRSAGSRWVPSARPRSAEQTRPSERLRAFARRSNASGRRRAPMRSASPRSGSVSCRRCGAFKTTSRSRCGRSWRSAACEARRSGGRRPWSAARGRTSAAWRSWRAILKRSSAVMRRSCASDAGRGCHGQCRHSCSRVWKAGPGRGASTSAWSAPRAWARRRSSGPSSGALSPHRRRPAAVRARRPPTKSGAFRER